VLIVEHEGIQHPTRSCILLEITEDSHGTLYDTRMKRNKVVYEVNDSLVHHVCISSN
jgi:hypothetical protein